MHVTTSDGEVFPVHRTLLRSCIALTKAVRDTQSAQPEVSVDVDCATFDRVLLFLEAASKLRQRRVAVRAEEGVRATGARTLGGEPGRTVIRGLVLVRVLPPPATRAVSCCRRLRSTCIRCLRSRSPPRPSAADCCASAARNGWARLKNASASIDGTRSSRRTPRAGAW